MLWGPCALHGIDAGWLQLLERAAQGCATACALKLASSRIVCLCTDAVVDPRLTKQLRPAAAVSLRSLSARVADVTLAEIHPLPTGLNSGSRVLNRLYDIAPECAECTTAPCDMGTPEPPPATTCSWLQCLLVILAGSSYFSSNYADLGAS